MLPTMQGLTALEEEFLFERRANMLTHEVQLVLEALFIWLGPSDHSRLLSIREKPVLGIELDAIGDLLKGLSCIFELLLNRLENR